LIDGGGVFLIYFLGGVLMGRVLWGKLFFFGEGGNDFVELGEKFRKVVKDRDYESKDHET
jgi:hypothetical protein